MEIVFLLYENFTMLDAIGPYEVLRGIPKAQIKFVAKESGLVRNDADVPLLNAAYSLDEVKSADILVIPGSPNPAAAIGDAATLAWVREIDTTTRWTTSVCTGALILAASGLLQGRRATTHWLTLEVLRSFGVEPVSERYVRDGKFITAAGVSAGIDMALELLAIECSVEVAQTTQLMIEYDPKPPFDAGSPAKAPATIVAQLRKSFSLA
jgi:transcriptional regulator GlxA family with amidase domain